MTSSRSQSIVGTLAVAIVLAACGGSSSSNTNAAATNATAVATSTTDPASAIPASALLYAQVVVRPTGSLAAGIDAGAKKLVGIASPGAMIDAAIDSALKPRHISYETTIRPWLGQRAGVALLGVSATKPQFALVADQTNPTLARTTLFALVRSSPANGSAAAVVSGTYRGVAYLAKPDGSAAVAVAGPFAIVGTLSGLRQVVDVEQGAAALSAAPDYQAAAAHAIDSAVVTAFVRTRQLLTLLVSAGSSGAAATTSASALLDKLIPANDAIFASGRLDASGLAVDIAAPKGGLGGQTGPSDLFASLPAGSWLALGASGVGAALAKLVSLFANVASGFTATSSGGGVKQCTVSPGGTSTCTTSTLTATTTTSTATVSPATTAILAAYTKILSQISDAALFVKGTQLATIEGGLEIRVSSPAGATQLFGELKGLLGGLNSTQVRIGQLSAAGVDRGFTATVPGVPFVIDIAQKGNLLLGTVGNGALADALSASNRLGSSATAALLGSGVRPVLALSLPAVAKLLQSLGAASSSTAAQILPYLNSLGTLAVGQSQSGGYVIERIAIG
jgi:hypothetical protein